MRFSLPRAWYCKAIHDFAVHHETCGTEFVGFNGRLAGHQNISRNLSRKAICNFAVHPDRCCYSGSAVRNSSVSNTRTVSSANTFSRLFILLFARKHMRILNQHTNMAGQLTWVMLVPTVSISPTLNQAKSITCTSSLFSLKIGRANGSANLRRQKANIGHPPASGNKIAL